MLYIEILGWTFALCNSIRVVQAIYVQSPRRGCRGLWSLNLRARLATATAAATAAVAVAGNLLRVGRAEVLQFADGLLSDSFDIRIHRVFSLSCLLATVFDVVRT
jgi:hypothetical protein